MRLVFSNITLAQPTNCTAALCGWEVTRRHSSSGSHLGHGRYFGLDPSLNTVADGDQRRVAAVSVGR